MSGFSSRYICATHIPYDTTHYRRMPSIYMKHHLIRAVWLEFQILQYGIRIQFYSTKSPYVITIYPYMIQAEDDKTTFALRSRAHPRFSRSTSPWKRVFSVTLPIMQPWRGYIEVLLFDLWRGEGCIITWANYLSEQYLAFLVSDLRIGGD